MEKKRFRLYRDSNLGLSIDGQLRIEVFLQIQIKMYSINYFHEEILLLSWLGPDRESQIKDEIHGPT